MKATLLVSRRTVVAQGVFIETVPWQVPAPLRGSNHSYKYRLALVAHDVCVLRYDNEAGKGDHCHVGRREFPYASSNVDRLLEDFGSDVRKWLDENRRL
jgi:hypothetical protein